MLFYYQYIMPTAFHFSLIKLLREPPGGPRSGGEAMSEAKPVRWRPCEAGARPNISEKRKMKNEK
jgi:hypothetical protein